MLNSGVPDARQRARKRHTFERSRGLAFAVTSFCLAAVDGIVERTLLKDGARRNIVG